MLEVGETVEVQGLCVTPIDANHCSGAVLFHFREPGKHTAFQIGQSWWRCGRVVPAVPPAVDARVDTRPAILRRPSCGVLSEPRPASAPLAGPWSYRVRHIASPRVFIAVADRRPSALSDATLWTPRFRWKVLLIEHKIRRL